MTVFEKIHKEFPSFDFKGVSEPFLMYLMPPTETAEFGIYYKHGIHV